jgi:hypothetical protein
MEMINRDSPIDVIFIQMLIHGEKSIAENRLP